ncbi:hypothetical protein RUM43_001980 [Polyplax serrata]|uniref:Uncharacterized protein n=1 Tax=Polyplax serrata TaxID=468196 RepID=A0AAN8PBX1_POLSC
MTKSETNEKKPGNDHQWEMINANSLGRCRNERKWVEGLRPDIFDITHQCVQYLRRIPNLCLAVTSRQRTTAYEEEGKQGRTDAKKLFDCLFFLSHKNQVQGYSGTQLKGGEEINVKETVWLFYRESQS